MIIKIVRVKKSIDGWQTCLFGQQIEKKYCNQFDIYIKWNSGIYAFFMGYITSTISESIGRWNSALGQHENKSNSVGIFVSNSNKILWRHDKHPIVSPQQLKYESQTEFDKNDIFRLSFNFKNDVVNIYHNDNYVDNIPLYGCTVITPAFALQSVNEELEIVKWSFDY